MNNMNPKSIETEKEKDNKQLEIQKIKFCIISNFRAQVSTQNLWLFTQDIKT